MFLLKERGKVDAELEVVGFVPDPADIDDVVVARAKAAVSVPQRAGG